MEFYFFGNLIKSFSSLLRILKSTITKKRPEEKNCYKDSLQEKVLGIRLNFFHFVFLDFPKGTKS